MSTEIDLSISFKIEGTGRFRPDPTWSDVSDAVTKAAISALHEFGITNCSSLDISLHIEGTP